MPDDVSTETNDDLRSALESAWDKAEAAEAPEAPAETAPAPEAQGETAEARAERVRDEKGRFTKAEQAAEKAAKAHPLDNQPQTGQAPLAPTAAAANAPVGPPTSWSIAAKAEFDKIPQPVRDAIAKREQEVNDGFAQLSARLAPVKELEPYMAIAQQANTTLPQAIKAWMSAEELLHKDFEQGMLSLCQHFNVDPRALAARWGNGGAQTPNAGTQMPPHLQQRLDALEARIEADRRAQEEQQLVGVKSEVSAFSSKPENKYFENVRPFMAELLNWGKAASLQEAYDMACWAHPEIRPLLLNEQQAAKTAAAQRTASEARRAAGSLNPGSPFPGTTTNSGSQNRTLRDELIAAYDAHTV